MNTRCIALNPGGDIIGTAARTLLPVSMHRMHMRQCIVISCGRNWSHIAQYLPLPTFFGGCDVVRIVDKCPELPIGYFIAVNPERGQFDESLWLLVIEVVWSAPGMKQPVYANLKMALPHFVWRTSERGYPGASTIARTSANPARPYSCRLMVFKRLICPSTCPLLQGSFSAAATSA